ncbi:MAG TPA: glycosyltransferase family 4 protein [Sphingobacteriaceae bacterium]
MKIAQIAPLYEAVPPKLYGGTERIVHYLTEELVTQGHEVTLFATADSKTSARLIANAKSGLRLDKSCTDTLAPHICQLHDVIQLAHEFDILHFHIDYLHFPCTQRLNTPCVTTLHGRLDIPELQGIYRRFILQRVISISMSQRAPLPRANWLGTVHHGLPRSLFRMGTGKGGYLAFIGRISPEKGVDRAIEIAIAAGMKIRIAAKIDKADQQYYDQNIKHLFGHPLVEFIGEIDEAQKGEFLGDAKGLLFPINWAEPFGLVMIEAMACGTPVIAFKNGSVPEVIDPYRSGYIVETIGEAVEAVFKLDRISRDGVRRVFEERFTSSKMASNYLEIYKAVIRTHQNSLNRSVKSFKTLPSFGNEGNVKKVI